MFDNRDHLCHMEDCRSAGALSNRIGRSLSHYLPFYSESKGEDKGPDRVSDIELPKIESIWFGYFCFSKKKKKQKEKKSKKIWGSCLHVGQCMHFNKCGPG